MVVLPQIFSFLSDMQLAWKVNYWISLPLEVFFGSLSLLTLSITVRNFKFVEVGLYLY